MEWLKIYYHLLSVGFICLVITSAHFAASRQYSWTQNTISDLGAQGYSRGWILRMGLIGFGLMMISGILLKTADRDIIYLVDIPVLFYAVAILMSGIFRAEPHHHPANTASREDLLHAAFTTGATMALSVAILMSGLLATTTLLRTTHVLILILLLLSSGLFGFRRNIDGVLERLMYIVSFVWLVMFYNW